MNIFKVIDEKFDLKEKIKNLSKLFLERNYFSSGKYYVSFDTFFDRYYFRKWKYSYGCYNLEEFKKKIKLSYSTSYIDKEEYFYAENEISAINFLQYAYNATKFVRESLIKDNNGYIDDDVNEFYEIFNNQFEYILSKLNQKIIKHTSEDYYILVPCNIKTAKSVESQTDENIAFLLYEYLSSLLIGNVERKREILKLLSNTYEPIIMDNLKRYNSGPVHDLFFELNSCLNNFNIRHNNSDPRRPKYYHKDLDTFTEEDYEEVYDLTYDLILDTSLINEYLTKNKPAYLKYKSKAGL